MTDVNIDDRDAVRTITIDRPSSRNGLTTTVVEDIAAAVRGVPADVRAIVLTGANGAFCSGLDLKDAMQRGFQSGPDLERGLRESFHGAIRSLVESDRPTIALVDGAAAGFGCDLALACDLRIVSDRGVFGEIFVKRGLMPDGGGTWLLPRIVGTGRALELLFTGDTVEAARALELGLGNKLWPASEFHGHAWAFARQLAKGPPRVLRLVKRAVHDGMDGPIEAALDREAEGQLECLGSKDFLEGVAAFLGKREPSFTGE